MDRLSDQEWFVELLKKKALYDFFIQWEWEWFCTLNLPDGKGYDDAESYLKKWNKISYEERMRIGYLGVWSRVPHPHVHLLMFGINGDKSLFDVDKKKWEKKWSKITKQRAVIRWINDVEAVSDYVSYRNTPLELYELVIPYGVNLMKRKKKKTLV